MINVQKYRAIKAKYGYVASWALWSESASSDTSDIEMFDDHLVQMTKQLLLRLAKTVSAFCLSTSATETY